MAGDERNEQSMLISLDSLSAGSPNQRGQAGSGADGASGLIDLAGLDSAGLGDGGHESPALVAPSFEAASPMRVAPVRSSKPLVVAGLTVGVLGLVAAGVFFGVKLGAEGEREAVAGAGSAAVVASSPGSVAGGAGAAAQGGAGAAAAGVAAAGQVGAGAEAAAGEAGAGAGAARAAAGEVGAAGEAGAAAAAAGGAAGEAEAAGGAEAAEADKPKKTYTPAQIAAWKRKQAEKKAEAEAAAAKAAEAAAKAPAAAKPASVAAAPAAAKKDEVDDMLGSLNGKKPSAARGGTVVAPDDPLLPPKLEKNQILTVVRQNAAGVAKCKGETNSEGGTVLVDLVILKTGTVESASVVSDQKGTPLAACVERKVKVFRFPNFNGPPMRIKLPFAM